MRPLDPGLGGFRYEHGSKWNYSPANRFDLRPEFGQSGNHFRYFGPAYAPANLGTSLSPFNFTYPFGFTMAGHITYPFGFNSSNGESFVPTFGHNSTTPFGFPSANCGTSAPTFGQNSTTPFGCATGGTFAPTSRQNSTTPFGFSPANGATSVPTFGQNTTTASRCALIHGGTSSTDSFGFTPTNTTSAPAWQSSNPLGSVPTNAGTPATTFGEGRNYFASALTNGATSVPACGAPLSSTLMQAASSSPIHDSLSGSTSFSQTPAVNASSSPGFSFGCTMTCSQPTLPSCTSSLFGRSPYLFGTQNHLSGSTTHFQTPAIDASGSPGFGFGCTTSGQATTQFGTSSALFGTSTCSGGIQVPFSGDQVKTPVFGGPSSGPLTYTVNPGGSRVTPYTETVEREAGSQLSTRLMSISAMPVFRDKCHEELRWEDKQLGDDGNIPLFHSLRSGQSAIGSQSKGSKVKPYTKTMVGEDGSTATSISAMPVYQNKSFEELRGEGHQYNNAGGGVDAASAQLNSFWNPASRTCSSFLNAMPSSIPPNIFASKPPCFTFPTCSTPFTSNSFLDDSHGGTYTSITETPSIFDSAFTFLHPNPLISSASAGKTSTSGPSLFNYTSSAPCASIWSTYVTAPVTVSVPCNFPPSLSPLDAVLPSRCSTETPPAVPQMSAEGPKATSVRYGISGTPAPIQVAFSTDAHEAPTTARKKVPLLPKDNSGVLISGPSEEWTLRINFKNISHIKHASIHVYENGEVSVELSKPLADSSMQDKVGKPLIEHRSPFGLSVLL